MSFAATLADAVRASRTSLCVGIDPHGAALGRLGGEPVAQARRFSLAVVEAAAGRVAVVKPQFAFFERLGPAGMGVLAEVCGEARARGLLVLGDAKRGDIGSTAEAYADATLAPGAPFPCDALTVSPFLGPESLAPFLAAADRHGRGLFVLLRTSNPGSARWQRPVADDVAAWLRREGEARRDRSGLSGLGAVVGATLGPELAEWRAALPDTWLLLPGFGAQGAGVADVAAGARPDGLGALVVSARGATLPSPANEAAWAEAPAAWIAGRIDAVKAELAAG